MVERSDLQTESDHAAEDAILNAGTAGAETIELAQSQPADQSGQSAQASNGAANAPASGLEVEKVGSYNGAAIKLTLTAEEDKPIVLPADTQIEAILVNGDDLLIREVNGDLILIKGGLKAIPTLVIGEFEIPAALAPGSTTWAYNASVNLDFLDAGEQITFSYTVTATDNNGATATDTVSVTITGTNDAPVVDSTTVWLPTDPAQQTPDFANGYPLLVNIPTDIDGENVKVTATNAPTGVLYFNGAT